MSDAPVGGAAAPEWLARLEALRVEIFDVCERNGVSILFAISDAEGKQIAMGGSTVAIIGLAEVAKARATEASK